MNPLVWGPARNLHLFMIRINGIKANFGFECGKLAKSGLERGSAFCRLTKGYNYIRMFFIELIG